MNQALRQYQKVNVQSGVQDADPHRLVQMLFQGALDRMNTARSCLRCNDVAGKGENISKAIQILSGLRDSLNFDAGELSNNLDALYDYMAQRLLETNVKNDEAGLVEVIGLITPIKQAWDEIRGQVIASKKMPEAV